MRKAVFLDRDGTINIDKGYVHKIEDFKLIPGTISALKIMQDAGYLLIIITNQSGIGSGIYKKEDFQEVTRHMLSLFSAKSIIISKIYFCPHTPLDACGCRKPSIKLIKDAEKEFNVSLRDSYFIGDKTLDIKCGKDSGCKTILVETGKAGKDGCYDVKPDFTAKDLYSAAKLITGNI